PGSLFDQALVAQRQTDFEFVATTCMHFEPEHFQHLAGLICYYNSRKFHYLYVSCDDEVGKCLGIMSCEAEPSLAVTFPAQHERVPLPSDRPVWLRATVRDAQLTFSWSLNGDDWLDFAAELDHSLLSDEAGIVDGEQFTGTFVGMTCNDLTGQRRHADFAHFTYRGEDER
ncbi:MAG: glycoside hydrolase 43 family protein, partial [Pseudomonadota bacterium]